MRLALAVAAVLLVGAWHLLLRLDLVVQSAVRPALPVSAMLGISVVGWTAVGCGALCGLTGKRPATAATRRTAAGLLLAAAVELGLLAWQLTREQTGPARVNFAFVTGSGPGRYVLTVLVSLVLPLVVSGLLLRRAAARP